VAFVSGMDTREDVAVEVFTLEPQASHAEGPAVDANA
jgi:hypothetical protein